MATKKKSTSLKGVTLEGKLNEEGVVIEQGSHLTVYIHKDGRRVLKWDDEALLRDVQKALTEYENSVKVNTTVTKPKRKKKNEA
jgi:NADH dehydrogenase FAD-containing subunit